MNNPPAETLEVEEDFDEPVEVKVRRRTQSPRNSADLTTLLSSAAIVAMLTVGLCLIVGLYSAATLPDATDRIGLCVLLMLPALMLVYGRSGLLLDYLLIIVVTNRELRRFLDWGQGQFDPTPYTSLLPLAIAAVMLSAIAKEWQQIPRQMRRASGYFAGAIAYGLALGLASYGFAAFVTCGEYVIPLIVMYYCVATRPSSAIMSRWIMTLATLGILAGVYGIYQWTDPPPWDASWVVWSKMTSSMGPPKPYEMSICSTLESRGPAAMFFAASAMVLIATPFLQRIGGFVFAVIPAVALLLTQARTGLIYLVLSLLASALFGRKGGLKIVLALIAVGGITFATLARNEQSTVIFDRVSTLNDLQNDGSANGRVDIAQEGISTVLTHPLGFGFGSGGMATRVSDKSVDAVGDNGYLEILSTLGVLGSLLYAIGIFTVARLALQNRQSSTALEPAARLGMGMLVALVPAMVVANQLISAHASYVWILLSSHLATQRHSRKSVVID